MAGCESHVHTKLRTLGGEELDLDGAPTLEAVKQAVRERWGAPLASQQLVCSHCQDVLSDLDKLADHTEDGVLTLTVIWLDTLHTPMNGMDLEMTAYMVNGTRFEVCTNYSPLHSVEQGGIVCAAREEKTGDVFAIRKIENAFEHCMIAKRTLRELRILRHLRHENLVDVKTVFVPGTKDCFDDIYVVSELMETDLASVFKSPQPLSDDHCQFFLYQILGGMKYVHSAEVTHCDLKPRNLLVNSNCDLKISGFGFASISLPGVVPDSSSGIVETRWYRAPEVLCAFTDGTKAIDVWSIGCICAEMFLRKPLLPGQNTQHQIHLIINLLGTPSQEEVQKIPNDKCRRFIDSLPAPPRQPFEGIVQEGNNAQLQLLKQTLQFDPDKRVSVDQALQLPYLTQLYCPEDEPTRGPLDTLDFEFERRKITLTALREELFLETLSYYPEQRQRYTEEQAWCGTMYNVTDLRLFNPGSSQHSSDEDT